MNKENVQRAPHLPSRSLTEEQRARISQNFRAAKALLARKRPYETVGTPIKGCDGSRTKSLVSRTPLSEVQINVDSPVSSSGADLMYSRHNKSCPGVRTIHGPISSVQFGLKTAEICIDKEMQTPPIKESEQSIHRELFSSPYLLEEDFDESVLKEIDSLCEQQSTTKMGRHSLSSNSSVEDQYKECNEYISLESVIPLKVSETESGTELRMEQEDKACSFLLQSHDGVMPKAYSEYLQSLNETQKEAACCDTSTPLMIVAGPGSGKTSTMVGRVLMLLKEGVAPSNILAMTFTTAAAAEMRDRIGSVTGKAIAKELTISTFHSFCLQLCRSHAEKLHRTSEFLIYGHGQQRRAVIEAVRLTENARKSEQNCGAFKLDDDASGMNGSAASCRDKSKKWQKFVTQAKASGRTPEECRKMHDEIGASILENYNDILRSCNALDYHDFISCSVTLLNDFHEVYKECQETWKAIVVDEFQDTSSMQYNFLRMLASHNCITIIGDDDQSIFSFNGANLCGFDSFRKDFPMHKEIRLSKNYRSTRCIVEAASSLIHHNVKRCQLKQVITDNCLGSKITVKECDNEEAQCAFVVDKILELTSDNSATKCAFGNISVLYRRQISGKAFQTSFRSRKIPFNVHGVAFYRKKVIKIILAILRTTLPSCDDGPFRHAFKALLPGEKEEKKKVIDYINKISSTRKCSFLLAASDIFRAKISGTFKRTQLTQGRKVLVTLEMISKLIHREQSLSVVVTSVANLLPQKYLLEQRAIVDADGGKLLNEDNDLRSVLQFLLDDVSDFLSTHISEIDVEQNCPVEEKGCTNLLKAFVDYISARESENFQSRKRDNKNSVTLTTIHQSKGLEWDTVFIVKANESEIPLLHEFNGAVKEGGASLEEERRLLYVAMTRARKKLYILYVTMDSNWQLLQPSRFLKEIPGHLLELQVDLSRKELLAKPPDVSNRTAESTKYEPSYDHSEGHCPKSEVNENVFHSIDLAEGGNGNLFLKRFHVDGRSTVSILFHQWAKKQAFQDPKRLLDKISFVIDERLRSKTSKNKDVLRNLKACLRCDEAFQYAQYILRWEQIPADKRIHLLKEKQEHFQRQRIENSMNSSEATSKQIAFLHSLGCTIVPTSRLHASRLIEQYKSL